MMLQNVHGLSYDHMNYSKYHSEYNIEKLQYSSGIQDEI